MLVIPTSQPDPILRGSCKTKGGTLIGLPANFRFRNAEEASADRAKLLVGGAGLDWSKDTSQRFLKSLVLSDSAKRFAIARQVKFADTWHVLNRPLMLSTTAILAYAVGHLANGLYGLRTRVPTRVRAVMYTGIGACALVFYTLVNDSYNCYLENASDRQAAELGKDYAQGGVEFYQKTLERNRALRELVPRGDKYYTAFGNRVATWRQREVPLMQRLEHCRRQLAKYEEGSDVIKASDVTKDEEECIHCKQY